MSATCDPSQGSLWFDGLGSAMVGGAVAALVAVAVTRAQLNHDRRMRREETVDQAALMVAATIGDLQATRRHSFTAPELKQVWARYGELIRALKVVAHAAAGDTRLQEWLTRFGRQLEGEIAHGVSRTGTNAQALDWAIQMAEQIAPRLRDRNTPLEDRDKPPFERSTD